MKLRVIHDLPAFVLVPQNQEDRRALAMLMGDGYELGGRFVVAKPVQVLAARVDAHDLRTNRVDRLVTDPPTASTPVAILVR